MANPTAPEQGTNEWLEERAGIPTASRFGDVMAVSKRDGKPLKARQTYMYQLAAERLRGPWPSFSSAAIQRGHDLEDYVRNLYAARANVPVTTAPFVKAECGLYGASPDGFVGTDGLVEIKTTAPHIYLVDLLDSREQVPEKFYWQMVGQCLVTGRPWCDLVQFCDEMELLRIIHLQPSDEELKKLHEQLLIFVAEVDAATDMLRDLLAELCLTVDQAEKALPADIDLGSAEPFSLAFDPFALPEVEYVDLEESQA